MEEQKMSYEEQVRILNNYGSVKELIKDEQFLTNLLVSSNDRHIIHILLDMANKQLKTGEITVDDLGLLRSGFLTNTILRLPELVKQAGRNLYPFEIGDKLNYLSVFEDVDTLNANYANPNLINTMNANPNNQELDYWISSGTIYSLPDETVLESAIKFIESGNVKKGTEILTMKKDSIKNYRSYQEQNGFTK